MAAATINYDLQSVIIKGEATSTHGNKIRKFFSFRPESRSLSGKSIFTDYMATFEVV